MNQEIWLHGIGLSSISDYSWEYLKNMANWAKKNNKLFAIHASERIREDINRILSLKPDFLIHMLEASDDDLRVLRDRNLPLVITPRSNLFFGKIPNIPKLLRYRILLALGTVCHIPQILPGIIGYAAQSYSLEPLILNSSHNYR